MIRITSHIPATETKAKRQPGQNDYYARIRAEALLEAIAKKHGLTVSQIKERTRMRSRSWPRQEYMHAAVEEQISYKTIAEVAGLKDHTSVIHGVRQHAARKEWERSRKSIPTNRTYPPESGYQVEREPMRGVR